MRILAISISLVAAVLFAPLHAYAQSNEYAVKGTDIYGMNGGGSVFSDDEKQMLSHNTAKQIMSGVKQLPAELQTHSNLFNSGAIYGVRREPSMGVLSGIQGRGFFHGGSGYFH